MYVFLPNVWRAKAYGILQNMLKYRDVQGVGDLALLGCGDGRTFNDPSNISLLSYAITAQDVKLQRMILTTPRTTPRAAFRVTPRTLVGHMIIIVLQQHYNEDHPFMILMVEEFIKDREHAFAYWGECLRCAFTNTSFLTLFYRM